MIYTLQTGPLGVNTYIVTPGDYDSSCPAFIVDPAACAFCGDGEVITSFLIEKSLSPLALVLTHGHFDHVAGLGLLKDKYPDAKVLIHKGDCDFIGSNSAALQGLCLSQMSFEDFIPSVSDLPGPDAFLEDGISIGDTLSATSDNDFLFQWKVIHSPGHTPGCVCIYNENESSLLSGDTIFYRSWGRTDLILGDESAIQASLKKIYTKLPAQTRIYPGHGQYGFTIEQNL